MAADDMDHLAFLHAIAEADVSVLQGKEATYQGSWKRAGGRSAWFMMRRNMDRLISMMARVEFKVDPEEIPLHKGQHLMLDVEQFDELVRALRSEDLFRTIQSDPSGRDGTVLACLRDLRRYAALVEAEMVAEGHVQIEYGPGYRVYDVSPTEPEDTIEPGTGLPERVLDEILRLACPEWSDATRAESVAHAIMKMPGASAYDQAAFVSGSPRENIKKFVLARMYGFNLDEDGRCDPSLGVVTPILERAVRHAVNCTGLDARLDTPDHVLAELLVPKIVAYLAGRTDVQLIDSGWTISNDGEGRAIPPEGWPGFPSVKLVIEHNGVTPPATVARWLEADPDVDAVTTLSDDPSGPGSPADGGHHAPSMPTEWSTDIHGFVERVGNLLSRSTGYIRVSAELQRSLPPVQTVFFSREPDGSIIFQLYGSGRVLNLSDLTQFSDTMSWRTDSLRAQRPAPTWEDVA